MSANTRKSSKRNRYIPWCILSLYFHVHVGVRFTNIGGVSSQRGRREDSKDSQIWSRESRCTIYERYNDETTWTRETKRSRIRYHLSVSMI